MAGGTQGLRMQVREWHAMGLPHDAVSVDSAIVAMHGRCWPLCIDPQVQLGDRSVYLPSSRSVLFRPAP